MLFDKIIKGKRAFKLKVKPKGYGNLNKPVPDEIPKPNVGCGIHTVKACFFRGLSARKEPWIMTMLKAQLLQHVSF